MLVADLMNHIDGCFKIWITEKDKKTEIGYFDDKYVIPEGIEKERVSNWFVCENRVKVALDR